MSFSKLNDESINALSADLKLMVIDGELSLQAAVDINAPASQLEVTTPREDIEKAILESKKEADTAAKKGNLAAPPSFITIPHGTVEELLRSNRFFGIKHLSRRLGVKLHLESGTSGGVSTGAEDNTHDTNLVIKANSSDALEVAMLEIRGIISDPETFKLELKMLREVSFNSV